MNLKLIPLSGIARSCSKIESALARKNIDLDCYFYEVDKKRCGLISGAKFFTVVYNQLGRNLGVCQEEVQELAKYFKKPDGRVDYPEFLNFVVPKDCNGKPLTSGLEWEDHEQVNVFSPFELRQLKVIITKIAWSCHLVKILSLFNIEYK